MPFIAPIVEGQGEIEAVPTLLYRMAAHFDLAEPLRINPPIRIKLGSFLNDAEYFRKYVSLAAAKAAQERGFVLILLDCDDLCPGELGPEILKNAQAIRADIPILVVLAYREFESWFVAAAQSLRGKLGLPADLTAPPDLEKMRNAKGWLAARMPNGYDPISHQHKLARLFDLEQACALPSFKRFLQRLRHLSAA